MIGTDRKAVAWRPAWRTAKPSIQTMWGGDSRRSRRLSAGSCARWDGRGGCLFRPYGSRLRLCAC